MQLAALTVAPENDVPGYSRAKFPHWVTQYGSCDTREVVLQRDGADVTQDAQCRAVSGSWLSAYDGLVLDAASKVDIDHIVPLKEAWRSGASRWTTEQRRAFANDLQRSQLIAVSARCNRAKGDKDPANWQPELGGYRCMYGRAWVGVKDAYGLAVDGNGMTRWSACSTPVPHDASGEPKTMCDASSGPAMIRHQYC